jgi:hypothetical protein
MTSPWRARVTPQARHTRTIRIAVTEGASTTRCRQCRKPIVWPGLCYTCATGLPRQLRPRTDPADESPVHQVATADEPGGPG